MPVRSLWLDQECDRISQFLLHVLLYFPTSSQVMPVPFEDRGYKALELTIP